MQLQKKVFPLIIVEKQLMEYLILLDLNLAVLALFPMLLILREYFLLMLKEIVLFMWLLLMVRHLVMNVHWLFLL